MGRPASSLPRITFRLSPELLDQLTRSAAENERSLNAELVARLEASFGTDAPLTPAQEEAVRQVANDVASKLLKQLEGLPGLAKRGLDRG